MISIRECFSNPGRDLSSAKFPIPTIEDGMKCYLNFVEMTHFIFDNGKQKVDKK